MTPRTKSKRAVFVWSDSCSQWAMRITSLPIADIVFKLFAHRISLADERSMSNHEWRLCLSGSLLEEKWLANCECYNSAPVQLKVATPLNPRWSQWIEVSFVSLFLNCGMNTLEPRRYQMILRVQHPQSEAITETHVPSVLSIGLFICGEDCDITSSRKITLNYGHYNGADASMNAPIWILLLDDTTKEIGEILRLCCRDAQMFRNV